MQRIQCASIFTDHMVLQQKKPIRIFGYAPEGETVTASLLDTAGQTICNEETIASPKGDDSYRYNFHLTLPSLPAGGPLTLVISGQGNEQITFFDVMIGEVWLAGGQSNMEFAIGSDQEFVTALQQAPTSNVRFFQVGQRAFFHENFLKEERFDHWMCGEDADFSTWSAVGYYFGAKLAARLGITIGIIGCNWGGTSACAWQDRDTLLSSEETAVYWTEYEDLLSTQSPKTYEAERIDYLAYQKEWQPRMDAYYAAHPDATWQEAQEAVGVCRWPGPMGPKHEFRPCGLYETMFSRIVPYALAGFIYYQGESDDHRPASYYTLLKNLIGLWRKDFADDTLPFLFVQLPMHRYRDNPITDSWCEIRQAQLQVHRDVPHTGLAVAIDCGEYNNIHPTRKRQVGERLALQALFHVYDLIGEEDAYGPLFHHFETEGDALRLFFSYAEGGFVTHPCPDREVPETLSFELAGADGIYHPAAAMLEGSTIVLRSSAVPAPTQVRYLWVDYRESIPLFGKNGLPMAPFRG